MRYACSSHVHGGPLHPCRSYSFIHWSAKAVKLLMELGVDVVALHRGETRKEILIQFFDRQPWATISSLPTGEYVVLIDHGQNRKTSSR